MKRAFFKAMGSYLASGTGRRALLPLALFMALSAGPAHAVLQELDGIIAVVDDDVVLGSELVERLDTVLQQLQRDDVQPPPRQVLVNQILERLILESLQLQEGAKRGIDIDDQALTQAVLAFAQQNRMTLDQFRRALAADGVSYGEFREQIRREMIITRVQRGLVNRRIQITDSDVQAILDSPYYEALLSDQFRVGHILLEVEEGASDETRQLARNRARQLVGELRDGAEFGPMAVTHSAGGRALEGGDLGWRRAGELPSLFAERVLDMQPGDTSDPIASGRGFHIIQLLGRQGASMEQVQQTKVRHILLQASEIRTDNETRQAIRELHTQIEQGADFAELAREHSEDPGSGLKGGDLGWSVSDDFVPEFAAIMDSTAVGGLSAPFRSQFGWHVLQVEERRMADMSDEALRNKAMQILHGQRFEDELQAWLKELRDEAFVEVRLPGVG